MEKRKAIDCKLVRPSNSNPGYFKYEVTIKEPDGAIHIQPAYGKDMQDAISRLIWNERVDKVAKASEKNRLDYPIMLGIVSVCIIGPGLWSVLADTPLFSVAGITLGLIAGTIFFWFNRWLNRR